ncbi:MAG: hypothetical protein L3J25_07910 [Flavobacteriaceae bacterium]|nr:hypothetical protein [Flavobacteriaceae bacterium]
MRGQAIIYSNCYDSFKLAITHNLKSISNTPIQLADKLYRKSSISSMINPIATNIMVIPNRAPDASTVPKLKPNVEKVIHPILTSVSIINQPNEYRIPAIKPKMDDCKCYSKAYLRNIF